jgi:sterol desaturase/sphingolipid hydroxylase (fatty acid hydroxylase superfamily)
VIVVLVGGALAALSAGGRPSLVLGVLAAVTLPAVVVLERLLPYDPAWNRDQGDLRADVAHGVVNTALLEGYKRVMYVLFVPAGAWLAARYGASLWPHRWPLVAQLALSATVAELFQYASHRGVHETRLFRFHATHHSSPRLYWLNTSRDHPIGLLLDNGAETASLLLLGIGERALAAQFALSLVVGLLQHANIDLRTGFLCRIFSTPELHRLHHSSRAGESMHNYGSNLTLWDQVFGTFQRPVAPPRALGCDGGGEYPRDYRGQLRAPFV